MNFTFQSFYKEFYGHNFFRHFRRPPDFDNKRFKIQFTVKNPRELYLHVHRNSGNHPCLTHIYDHGSLGNLKTRDHKKIVYDRAFFDFDIHHNQSHNIKKEMQDLSRYGLKHKPHQYCEMKDQLRNLIIDNQIAAPAINEVKDFAIKFKESFGAYPLLFFSGGKGCHAYTFFEPIQQININKVISWFGKSVKNRYQYNTIDLSVLQDAKSRLSRVPYSKHQYTDLTVVPFTIDDSYDSIIDKSLNPQVESFKKENYLSAFGEYLKKIDPVLRHNEKMKKITEEVKKVEIKGFKSFKKIDDHRIFFKEISRYSRT